MIYFVVWHTKQSSSGQTWFEAISFAIGAKSAILFLKESPIKGYIWGPYRTATIPSQHIPHPPFSTGAKIKHKKATPIKRLAACYEYTTVSNPSTGKQICQVFRSESPTAIQFLTNKYGNRNPRKSFAGNLHRTKAPQRRSPASK